MKSNVRTAVVALVVLLVLVGGAGWYLAAVRTAALGTAQAALQNANTRAGALAQERDSLQQNLTAARAQLAAVQQQAEQAQADAKNQAATADGLKTQLTDATARADAAEAQLKARSTRTTRGRSHVPG